MYIFQTLFVVLGLAFGSDELNIKNTTQIAVSDI